MISAASPGQTCGLDDDAGLFTRYFLQGLKERDGNMKAAFDFLEPEVKKAAQAAYKASENERRLDYLASLAMQGLLANDTSTHDNLIAECAYDVAEAMLAEREKRLAFKAL